jgi:hypothetical protein
MEIIRRGAFLRGAFLENAELDRSEFLESDLGEIRLRGASLTECRLVDVDLERADLSGTNLCHIKMQGCRLTGADLTNSDMGFAEFQSCDLRGARLNGSWFHDGVLNNCRLEDASLSGVVLNNTRLVGCKLAGASLRGACLEGVQFEDTMLEGVDLAGARYDATTQFPPSFTPPPDCLSKVIGANHARVASSIRLARRRPGLRRVWTGQPLVVWEELQRIGSLHKRGEFVRAFESLCAEWLRGQLLQRVPGYSGHYPWWGNLRRTVDLRRATYVEDNCVKLELQLPPDEVLILDGSAWYRIFFRSYLPLTQQEEDEFEAALKDAIGFTSALPTPEPWRTRIVQSWKRVFALETLAQSELWGQDREFWDGEYALFENLRLENVVQVRMLEAR